MPAIENAGPGQLIAILAIGGGVALGVLAILAGVVWSALEARFREQSRREIAAYVAEGTISPEDAERLLAAPVASRFAPGQWKHGNFDYVADQLAEAVGSEDLSADDAKRLADARGTMDDRQWAKAVEFAVEQSLSAETALHLAKANQPTSTQGQAV